MVSVAYFKIRLELYGNWYLIAARSTQEAQAAAAADDKVLGDAWLGSTMASYEIVSPCATPTIIDKGRPQAL